MAVTTKQPQARTLWDVVDSSSDGESSDHSDFRVAEIVGDCEDSSLEDYYNQDCSWVGHD